MKFAAKICKAILTFVLALNMATGAAVAENRVALVIGNSDYENLNSLNNPANDAEAIGTTLSSLDFTVYLATNLNKQRLDRTIEFFSERSKEADVSLVYFAGHGAQIGGKNYLLPTDFGTGSSFDASSAFDLSNILDLLGTQLSTNIVIIDACLERPEALDAELADVWTTENVNAIAPRLGTILSFATTAGKAAYDGTGSHSPFSGALLDHLATPALDIDLMLRNVRRDVVVNSNGLQVPTTLSSLMSEFQLLPKHLIARQHLMVRPSIPNKSPVSSLAEQGFGHKSVLGNVAAGIETPLDNVAVDIANRIRSREVTRNKKRQADLDDLRALICNRLDPPKPESCRSL